MSSSKTTNGLRSRGFLGRLASLFVTNPNAAKKTEKSALKAGDGSYCFFFNNCRGPCLLKVDKSLPLQSATKLAPLAPNCGWPPWTPSFCKSHLFCLVARRRSPLILRSQTEHFSNIEKVNLTGQILFFAKKRPGLISKNPVQLQILRSSGNKVRSNFAHDPLRSLVHVHRNAPAPCVPGVVVR